MPARIPKDSRASCTAPDTSRLEPDTICPAASSSTDVVNVAPGRKTTSAATIARIPGSRRSSSTASALSAETTKAATTGIRTCNGCWFLPTERRTPTRAPKTAAATTSRGAGCRIRHNPNVRTE